MEKFNLSSTTLPQTSVNIDAGQAPRSPMGSPRQTPPTITSGAQEAPSLAHAGSGKLQKAQFKPKPLQVAIGLLNSLIDKHSKEGAVSDQIFKILSRNSDLRATLDQEIESIRNAKKDLAPEDIEQIESLQKLQKDPNLGTTVIDHIYLIKDEATICNIESFLEQIINKSPNEILKCLGILNKTSSLSTPISNYIFEYLESLKHTGLMPRINLDDICLGKLPLYFTYGLLSKNQDILGALTSLMESESIQINSVLFRKVELNFCQFMLSLKASDAENYCISGSYDGIILYACKNFPILVDNNHNDVLRYFCTEAFNQNILNVLILKNTKGEYLLDSLYSEVDPVTMTDPSVFMTEPFASILMLENWLYCGTHPQILGVRTALEYFKLPHLLSYLEKVPFESLTKERKENYLLLSIALKNTKLIQRFSKIRIDTEKLCTSLELILVGLFRNVFGTDGEGNILDQGIVQKLFQGQVVPGSPRELFFEILSNLKHLNVLQSTSVMSLVLSDSLKYDLNYPHEASTFDYVLENLKRIGFDPHFIEPAYKGNLIFEAFDQGNVDLIVKFIALGVNPFRMNDRGLSFLKIEHYLSSIPESKIEEIPNLAPVQINFRKQWKIRGLSVLKLVGLDQHEALVFYKQVPQFEKERQKYLLKNKQAVCATLSKKDSKGRSGLMVLVMCNQDINPLLPHIKSEDLLAKDAEGKTVMDYAIHNNDQVTIKLLTKHEKNLRKKGAFRKGAKVVFSGGKSLRTSTVMSLVESSKSQGKKEEKGSKTVLTKQKSPQIEGRISAQEKNKEKKPVLINLETQAPKTETPEINLYYDEQSETVETETKKARKTAQEAIEKAEAKQKKKEEKVALKAGGVEPSEEKKGFFHKAKGKMKAVVKALDTARTIATDPSQLARSLAEKLQKKANPIERLRQSEKVLRLSKRQAPAMLEDGFWLGNFTSLSAIADEALGEGLLNTPSSGIKKTLEAMDDAIKTNNKGANIDRKRILECVQWVMGGKIAPGHGSHLNLRWHGGGLTIPRNKNGSDDADIVYIKQAAQEIAWALRSLLLGYATTQSTVSSSETSEGDEWNSTNEPSFIEETKGETPEASESSEEDTA
jgi:hypothetical protein